MKGSVPEFVVELTDRFVAVLKALVALSVKYQMLLVPPDALNTIVFPGQILAGVPAFTGAGGIS